MGFIKKKKTKKKNKLLIKLIKVYNSKWPSIFNKYE